MNQKLMIVVVGLLALGALEFGLLGASASGLVGGSGHTLPPIQQRSTLPDTATATAIPAATSTPETIGFYEAGSIELKRPQPSAIPCDGNTPSTIQVFLRNGLGDPVKDGTPVYFDVFNGSASPPNATTYRGAASTNVVIYSDSYSAQPNVGVRSGDLETAVRLRCLPNSNCPVSPPPNSSPPCAPAPFPCNPSPGADVNSPPCAVVTPISPPICAPNQTSRPCTPFSPPPCDPTETSPPCVVPTPDPCAHSPLICPPVSVPGTPPMTGGEIYLGTPTLLEGDIAVPVEVTDSPDAYLGFSLRIRVDTSLAAFVDVRAEGLVQALGPAGSVACTLDKAPDFAGATCVIEPQPTTISGARTLAYLLFAPLASSGCLPLHLITFGVPDLGKLDRGTYTIGRSAANVVEAQLNTYGPDAFVNIADEMPCTPSPESTPTPPGPDAQTATAIAGQPEVSTMTPTATPTSTQAPSATREPQRTKTPARTASPAVQGTPTPVAAVCADVTGDGRVTPRDVIAIAAHMIGRYRLLYDLNHDHRVNREDLRLAIGQLGHRC
jgi:hypothetical protein